MKRKFTSVLLLMLLSISSLWASGADIVYYPTPASDMILAEIPGVKGKSGILLGVFEIRANNNSQFTVNFSRPAIYEKIIFTGSVEGRVDDLEFDLFYTWDGDNAFKSGVFSGKDGIDIRIFKQNGETCHLKIYLKVDKDISKLNGIYELKDRGDLPMMTVSSITVKDKNFSLTVNGQLQTASNRTPVNLTGSTPMVEKGDGSIVPGVSTDRGQVIIPTVPVITIDFLDPYSGLELDHGTYSLELSRVLQSYQRTPVTRIRASASNSNGSDAVTDFGNDYRYQITITSGGALTDPSGKSLPYTLMTERLNSSNMTLTGSDAYYVLSDLKTSGNGIIGVYFSFADQRTLLNATAGTYTDTVTVTVTNLY